MKFKEDSSQNISIFSKMIKSFSQIYIQTQNQTLNLLQLNENLSIGHRDSLNFARQWVQNFARFRFTWNAQRAGELRVRGRVAKGVNRFVVTGELAQKDHFRLA